MRPVRIPYFYEEGREALKTALPEVRRLLEAPVLRSA